MFLNFILFIFFELIIEVFNNTRVWSNVYFSKTFNHISKFKLLNNTIIFVACKVKLVMLLIICYLFIAIYSLNIFSVIFLLLSIYLLIMAPKAKASIELIAVLYFYIYTLNIFISVVITIFLMCLLYIFIRKERLNFKFSFKVNAIIRSIIIFVTIVTSYLLANRYILIKFPSLNYAVIILTFVIIITGINFLVIDIENNKKISNIIYNKMILNYMSSVLNPLTLYSERFKKSLFETISISFALYLGYYIVNYENLLVKPLNLIFYVVISILYTNDVLIYRNITNFSIIYTNKITKIIIDLLMFTYLFSLVFIPVTNQYIVEEYSTDLMLNSQYNQLKIIIFISLAIIFIYRYIRLFKKRNGEYND